MTLATSLQPHRRAVPVGHDQRLVVDAPSSTGRWPERCRMCGPYSVPVGMLTFQLLQRLIDFVESDLARRPACSGSTCTRTAYFGAPNTCTCATPSTMEMRCAIMVSAYSSRSDSGMVGEVRKRLMIGRIAGIDFAERRRRRHARRQQRHGCGDRGLHVHRGAIDIAAQIELQGDVGAMPWRCCEIIESRPAMVVNCRSSGVATAEAMVSGLAPGRLADDREGGIIDVRQIADRQGVDRR